MNTWLVNLRARGLGARAVVLTTVALGLYVAVAPVACCLGGTVGLWAAAAASGFCLAGAMTALVTGHLLRGPKHALFGFLAATAARMGIPLTAAVLCHFHGGALAKAGLLYYLLVFYPAILGIETALSLPLAHPPKRSSTPADATP